MNTIPYTSWLSLPLPTRAKIAHLFGIAKIRSTHVSNDVVIDDGYNIKQVEEAITVPALQSHLDSEETDVHVLFRMLVDKVEGREPVSAPMAMIDEPEPSVTVTPAIVEESLPPVTEDKPKKKRVTKKK